MASDIPMLPTTTAPEHLNDIAEEAPISRQGSQPTLNAFEFSSNAQPEAVNPHPHHVHHEHPPPVHKEKARRRNSSVSRVSVDFFDPSGVEQLRRTLTQQERDRSATKSVADSEVTLTFKDDEPFDFAKTLRRAVRKRDEGNIKSRTLGIVFEDLHVVGKAAADSIQPTLGSVLTPLSTIQLIQKARHPSLRDILKGFEGVVKPGEMLLVLGSPGSGCTSFLKALANHRAEYHSITGNVHYDSLTPSELSKYFRGDVQYCPEDDIHFPTLTVEQTLKFAAMARTPTGDVRGAFSKDREEFASNVTEVLMTIFGLRHARNTPVGDAMLRGVSGGEKKRVSIAEALAARSLIGAWDNSTRGLDASTALEFVQALRIATDIFQTTTLVSIYQAGESLYEHFDKVCVIYEGRMAYFGPADQAKQYFIDMGYIPANRQTTADFLVAVTDPNGRIPRPGAIGQPRTADEFAQYFLTSKLGRKNREEIEAYKHQYVDKSELKHAYAESARAEFAKRSGMKNPYMLTIPQQVKIVMKRRVQILMGNSLATGMQLFAFVFQSVIMGSVFLRAPEATGAYFSRGGVLFFALLFSALSSMAEIPALFSQRPIVARHEKAAFYHPFVEALALTLVDIPITLVTLIVFSIILYFMVQLQQTAHQFFIFYLFLVVMTLCMKAYFRAVAAAFASEATAQGFGGISVLALTIYVGYSIPKPSMIGALRWITYINPLKYGFEAVMTNEFRTLDGVCSNLVPQGPGYENATLANQVCATVGSVPGQATVSGARFLELSYGFKFSTLWMNFGIIVAFTIAFLSVLLLFSEFNTTLSTDSATTLFKPSSKAKAAKKKADEEFGDEKAVQHSYPPAPAHDNEVASTDVIPQTNEIFSWQNLNYVVPIPGEADRKLLSDVWGYVAPGKLTALMGESGAGKTTLLNVLAERTDTGVITGNRFVNGQPLPPDFQSQSGYCQQMDTHEPLSTVREALLFSAKLRQPPSVPLSEKEAYVEKCLEMCGLTEYADAMVGSLSIEHKKRTTIAVELAAKPKLLLFLDEPTSGLDSQSAWAIVSFLRSLADKGQAILCTIHQPSAELFQVFDRVLLLKKGGKTVYFGDLGPNAHTLINYFENHGARKCVELENPAEYMLDVIGAGATASSEQDWHDVWLKSHEVVQVKQEIETIHTEGRNKPALTAEFRSEFATSWFYQMTELFKRDIQAHWRDPTYLMAKFTVHILGALFIGFTFWQSKDTQQGTQNKLFSIFMITILSVPLANQLQVPFIAMRKIYEIRERPSRMYSWTALVASQIFAEIPWNIVGCMLTFFCWYWTVGYDSARAGYTFLMLVVAMPAYYTTFGQTVAAMAPSAEIAALLFSFLFSFVLTFNGVMQPFSQLGWWRWMYRLSPYTYLIEGLLGQALGRKEINCAPVEFATLEPPAGLTCNEYMSNYMSFAGGYLTNPDATSACQFCSVRTSDEFLGLAFNIYYDNHWRNFGIMIAFIVFNIALVYAMTYVFRIRKGNILPSLKRKTK
ncbi:hypothetical protein CVT24_005458 [Panaeolus cyanescens]|uniref:ABC transporter domain-containing protein n=1 Tax=Panaeolus cyanescens TaxID=181874 RepID=A0A409YC62_9AGAR|nr:hypothetical protein CVT24_005458 [Panaeolus cyanescens]